MRITGSTSNTPTAGLLAQRVRVFLCQIAGQAKPITYQALAKALELSPPNTIHQLTTALEYLIEEDAKAARPLIATLVVSKTRGGLPAPGFFECAQSVGCFESDPSDPDGAVFYATEFKRADAFWSAPFEPVLAKIQGPK